MIGKIGIGTNVELHVGRICTRERICRAYGAWGVFALYPALTRWASFFRASGAWTGTSEQPASEGGPYKIARRGVKFAACATPSESEGF
jgi:hypothetical protein